MTMTYGRTLQIARLIEATRHELPVTFQRDPSSSVVHATARSIVNSIGERFPADADILTGYVIMSGFLEWCISIRQILAMMDDDRFYVDYHAR